MKRINASSHRATEALILVEFLQVYFVKALEGLGGPKLECVEWSRDDGRHGGGQRFCIEDSPLFSRASVNVSQVHYDDESERKLGSASAISTIVHPAHPLAPSVHIHVSWTEAKDGAGYWRIMADLNPAMPSPAQAERFVAALKRAAPDDFVEATVEGDRYFYIPALERHRGEAHFCLETHNSGDFEADLSMAKRVGIAATDTYIRLMKDVLQRGAEPTVEERAAQLAYHTLYFFQVLTLDRGTTTGILVHNQNDIGILGSLPPQVDKTLLTAWRSRLPAPQNQLLDRLLAALPDSDICRVDGPTKERLADAIRTHYVHFPEAFDLQAAASDTPPTLDNHR